MIPEYPKIQTLWKRESEKPCRIIEGDYATPELAALAQAPIWTLTEKIDGTNIRVVWNPQPRTDGALTFYGRTERAIIPIPLIEMLAQAFTPDNLTEVFGQEPPDEPTILYGEGFGPKIQKGGGNYGDTVDFALFDVRCGGLWLKRNDVEDIASRLGITVAPVIERDATLGWMNRFVESGITSQWGDFPAEGLVARPEPEFQDRRGKRIITKLKTKDFR